MKYAFIKDHCCEYKITRLTTVLDVSVSGYYDWLNRPESPRAKSNRRLTAKIQTFHQASRGTYGSPRIHKDLEEQGDKVSVNRVARLMRDGDIQSKMTKKFVITTDSRHGLQPAPDLLQRRFTVAQPDHPIQRLLLRGKAGCILLS
ncbi:MAG: IS3 family transposase [Pseudomonadales bacterium]